MVGLSQEHREQLRGAKRVLEHPSFAIRLSNLVGMPLEAGVALLPADWQARIVGVTRRSLARALDAALFTMGSSSLVPTGDRFHKLAVTMTGGIGGAFGLASLAVELPVSTTIMLRSIADVARSHGEDLRDPLAKLACLEVFALGAPSSEDDAVESSYFVVRAALGQAVTEAARHLAAKAGAKSAAPPLVHFLTEVAARFGIVVSEKAAAQAVPVVGAGGGALVNHLFMDHFQTVARGHFTVRRLERIYDPATVRRSYRALAT